MLLTRNSGRKDTAFLLIDKHFTRFFLRIMNIVMNIALDSEKGWRVGRKLPS